MRRIKTIFITIFIIIILCSVSFAEKKICHTCNKEITKASLTAEGKYFHPTHFICANCKKPIDENVYYYENGKFYDKKCYEKINYLPCAFCGEKITNRYIEYNGKKYHRQCYDNNFAIKCDLCGEILEGHYKVDIWGNKYCQSHLQNHPQCDFCRAFFGAPTNNGGYLYKDGRKICTLCKETAVDSKAKLFELADEVNAHLKMYNLDIPLDRIKLYMVDRTRLSQISPDYSDNLFGVTLYKEKSSFFGLVQDKCYNIYILDGMPEMRVVEALAHEFNHVWQILRSGKSKNGAFCEGSCNYAAYLVLSQYEGIIPDMLIENLFEEDDKNYG